MSIVIVIDDDPAMLHLMRQAFCDTAVTVETARTAAEGIEMIPRLNPDLVVLDVLLPDADGIEAFQKIKQTDPRLPVLFITGGGSSDTAIEAVKAGALDYLTKPLDMERVRELVGQALEMRRRMNVPVMWSGAPPGEDHEFDDRMVGRSPQMLEVYKAIGRVAPQDVTVLIRGESGTGKELIARAIYQHSPRSQSPFLAVNCAAIPDALLESELFGHEKGSFTGADRQRIGKFEQCSGGTIFLDEVGDMSPLVQGKLLRLLQEQTFERVGGNQTIQTDVRIIAATHRDVEGMSTEGTFRADLYYRLNGFAITVPPLRDRGDDILLLVERMLNVYARQLGKDTLKTSPDALKLLAEYQWPGNVREMQSAVRRALLQTTGPVLLAGSLPAEIRTGFRNAGQKTTAPGAARNLESLIDARLKANSNHLYAETLAAMESCLLTRVLKSTEGNQSRAARVLGITRGSLRAKIHALNIRIGSVVILDDEPAEVQEPVTT
jgi:two-component system nitrogen regulation response regulator GlnG